MLAVSPESSHQARPAPPLTGASRGSTASRRRLETAGKYKFKKSFINQKYKEGIFFTPDRKQLYFSLTVTTQAFL